MSEQVQESDGKWAPVITDDDGMTFVHPREFREAPGNPRTIRDDRFEDLCHSLEQRPEMLEARPIIVDEETGDAIGGNMRHRAALALLEREAPGFTAYVEGNGGVPVYLKTFASDAERREWTLSDNNPYGEWIPDELAAMVAQHASEGADLRLLGFGEGEAEALRALAADHEPAEPGGHGDPDLAPPAPEEPTTQPRDIWRLGEHVLMCGDASSAADLSWLLSTAQIDAVDLVWTDPPYGVGYDAEKRAGVGTHWFFSEERLAHAFGEIQGDEQRSVAEYAVWLLDVLRNITAPLRPGGTVYLCHADKMVEAVATAWRQTGLFYAQQIMWRKTVLVFGRADYHFLHEPLFYGWKPGAAHRWLGDRTHTTMIEAVNGRGSARGDDGHGGYVHPTQKPYELLRPMLENSSAPGDVVFDPFGGSGSTLIAAERLGRRCLMMELDRRYCDVIVERWRSYSGGEPERIVF